MPNKLIDLTGMRFGNLVVQSRSTPKKGEKPKWICLCDCGNSTEVLGSVLKRGNTVSCGCFKGKRRSPFLVKVGEHDVTALYRRTHKNRLYHTWSEMRRRCNGKGTNRKYYGCKGVSICDEWEDFDVFAKWAIDNGYQPGLEIDRIDSDQDYCPGNCRWVTHKMNSRNRKARVNNKTGVPGVYERKWKNGGVSYRVTIATDSGKINLGSYPTIEEAAKVRREAELKYWGFNIGE